MLDIEHKAITIVDDDEKQQFQNSTTIFKHEEYPLNDPLKTLDEMQSYRFQVAAGLVGAVALSVFPIGEGVMRMGEHSTFLKGMCEAFTPVIFDFLTLSAGVRTIQRTSQGIEEIQSRLRENFIISKTQAQSPNQE